MAMPPEQSASLSYQHEHFGDDGRSVINGVCWALSVLAVVAIGLRFYAKRISGSRFHPEDGFILVGLFGCVALTICNTVGTNYGAGMHSIRSAPPDLMAQAKISYAFQIVYCPTIASIKFSVLTFFFRTFRPYRWFRIAIWCMAAFVGCWFFVVTFGITFQCVPIHFAWDKLQPGHCIDLEAFIVSTAIINVTTDFIIVAMPIPVIWKLQLSPRKKYALCGVFLVGGVVFIASILRLTTLHTLDPFDFSYAALEIGIWTVVEACIGVVGACLPLMTPILRSIRERRMQGQSCLVSGSSDWTHDQMEQVQKGPLQKHVRSNDNVPLAKHKEWPTSSVKIVANPSSATQADHQVSLHMG